MAGKGDRARPLSVSQRTYADRWDATFMQSDGQENGPEMRRETPEPPESCISAPNPAYQAVNDHA